jgi:PadR family transcriptional regulator
MAYRHLEDSLTKGNLWMYVLSALSEGPASPSEVRRKVTAAYGFSPASITFYSVVYRLRKQGLVRKVTDDFRAKYVVTGEGRRELELALKLLGEVGKRVSPRHPSAAEAR